MFNKNVIKIVIILGAILLLPTNSFAKAKEIDSQVIKASKVRDLKRTLNLRLSQATRDARKAVLTPQERKEIKKLIEIAKNRVNALPSKQRTQLSISRIKANVKSIELISMGSFNKSLISKLSNQQLSKKKKDLKTKLEIARKTVKSVDVNKAKRADFDQLARLANLRIKDISKKYKTNIAISMIENEVNAISAAAKELKDKENKDLKKSLDDTSIAMVEEMDAIEKEAKEKARITKLRKNYSRSSAIARDKDIFADIVVPIENRAEKRQQTANLVAEQKAKKLVDLRKKYSRTKTGPEVKKYEIKITSNDDRADKRRQYKEFAAEQKALKEKNERIAKQQINIPKRDKQLKDKQIKIQKPVAEKVKDIVQPIRKISYNDHLNTKLARKEDKVLKQPVQIVKEEKLLSKRAQKSQEMYGILNKKETKEQVAPEKIKPIVTITEEFKEQPVQVVKEEKLLSKRAQKSQEMYGILNKKEAKEQVAPEKIKPIVTITEEFKKQPVQVVKEEKPVSDRVKNSQEMYGLKKKKTEELTATEKEIKKLKEKAKKQEEEIAKLKERPSKTEKEKTKLDKMEKEKEGYYSEMAKLAIKIRKLNEKIEEEKEEENWIAKIKAVFESGILQTKLAPADNNNNMFALFAMFMQMLNNNNRPQVATAQGQYIVPGHHIVNAMGQTYEIDPAYDGDVIVRRNRNRPSRERQYNASRREDAMLPSMIYVDGYRRDGFENDATRFFNPSNVSQS